MKLHLTISAQETKFKTNKHTHTQKKRKEKELKSTINNTKQLC